ncbi:MAG: hypothetical protein HQM08_03345 [Candidatus Riflebacteria bacterium]|nr:hypothetical protein [Candidatus Riflebacteria bacterium]
MVEEKFWHKHCCEIFCKRKFAGFARISTLGFEKLKKVFSELILMLGLEQVHCILSGFGKTKFPLSSPQKSNFRAFAKFENTTPIQIFLHSLIAINLKNVYLSIPPACFEKDFPLPYIEPSRVSIFSESSDQLENTFLLLKKLPGNDFFFFSAADLPFIDKDEILEMITFAKKLNSFSIPLVPVPLIPEKSRKNSIRFKEGEFTAGQAFSGPIGKAIDSDFLNKIERVITSPWDFLKKQSPGFLFRATLGKISLKEVEKMISKYLEYPMSFYLCKNSGFARNLSTFENHIEAKPIFTLEGR